MKEKRFKYLSVLVSSLKHLVSQSENIIKRNNSCSIKILSETKWMEHKHKKHS